MPIREYFLWILPLREDGILSISGNTISGWGDGQDMGDIVINGVQDLNN